MDYSLSYDFDGVLDYATLLRSRISSRRGLMGLYELVESVQDAKRATLMLRRGVFRRGIEVESNSEFLREVLLDRLGERNAWGQTLMDVLEELEDDVNIVDDAFLYLPIDVNEDGTVSRGYPVRLDPTSTEFTITEGRLGGVFFCPACKLQNCDCGIGAVEAVAQTDYNGKKLLICKEELCHFSRYSPSKLYGRSPILTVLNEMLALDGASKALYQTFYKSKLPRGAVVVTTPDTEGFRAERQEIQSRLKNDPNYVPFIVLRSGQGQLGNQQSDLKFVQFGADLLDERSIGILKMLGDRVAGIYGVKAQNSPDHATTRLSDDLSQSRYIEDAQRSYNEKVFPFLLDAWGYGKDATLRLLPPEEYLEKQKIDRLNSKSIVAARMHQMGIPVEATGDDVTWGGKSAAGSAVNISDNSRSETIEIGNTKATPEGRVLND